jgi:hypothetical protein
MSLGWDKDTGKGVGMGNRRKNVKKGAGVRAPLTFFFCGCTPKRKDHGGAVLNYSNAVLK